jgi:hypothetical protein
MPIEKETPCSNAPRIEGRADLLQRPREPYLSTGYLLNRLYRTPVISEHLQDPNTLFFDFPCMGAKGVPAPEAHVG